ncbi:MAG: pyridoxamine 5'-phosphate oxidase [SAR86 cluster bacterium]|uniref:Pyridoxamine 5'-phosphate oxidase n=1 Tax=SAR86 cluster bacterium TaxID=2030880 RepID=A0A2A5CJ23_9GAMM|nr:pyridoxamine 5'-phosphate oxidase family protein [Gammaproteobacteria bacterium AH-315-E17]PCJ43501.1 MAG: pyridoxamine 5'-phosphate oxidase [SAR86 cluster bacterium]
MSNEDNFNLSLITTDTQLREILGPVSERARTKTRTELTEIDRLWIAASPFCLIATSDENGSCDVSPKGDPSGFTLILDEKTIVIPERLGNRRADSFHNILQNGHAGLLYLIPGRGDTLRINGRASLINDAPFFDELIVRGHRPALALLLKVEEVFFHCSKAFLRSDLWKSETWNPDRAPSRPCIAKELENTEASLEELEVYYGEQYRKGLYGESG